MIMGRSSTLVSISAGATARGAITSPRARTVIVGTIIAIGAILRITSMVMRSTIITHALLPAVEGRLVVLKFGVHET